MHEAKQETGAGQGSGEGRDTMNGLARQRPTTINLVLAAFETWRMDAEPGLDNGCGMHIELGM